MSTPDDLDELRSDYRRYDHCVDIVSAAEVWFTKASGMRDTAAHFERYPSIPHADGEPATPDFTVLFHDRTAYASEVSNLSREASSLDSLCRQLGRYDQLTQVPGGSLAEISAIDVLLFVPHSESIAALQRIAAAAADPGHPYSPSRFPTVLAWSFDADRTKYTFTFDRRSPNEPPRGHGREHSLDRWLERSQDTLTGMPAHFMPFKVAARFMNDTPPKLYMATLLWSDVLPAISGGESDINASPGELAAQLRRRYGRGKAAEVKLALEFLAAAGLAERHGDRWIIGHSSISRHADDLVDTLLRRYAAKPPGPVTLAARQRAKDDREERERNRSQQTRMDTGT